MFNLRITIKPKQDLSLLFLFSLFFFFAPYLLSGLLFISVLFFLLFNQKSILPLLLGCLWGCLLNISVLIEREEAFSGLETGKVNSIELVLSDDSFISSQGKLIIRGDLINVEGGKGESCKAKGSTLLLGKNEEESYFNGEVIRVSASLDKFPESNELDFIAYARGDIARRGWSKQIYRYRNESISIFDRTARSLPDDSEALFRALFRGNSDFLDRELKDNFRKSGVPHLLALSGFHVAVLVIILTALSGKVIGDRIAYLIASPFLVAYLFFAGSSPSLIRAVLMFLLAALFKYAGRKISIEFLLMITCLIQITLWPVQGWSLSFQLSYLALGGLLILGKRIGAMLESRLPSFLSLPISASLGAHISTAPLLILKFGELYPIGLLSSLVVTPLIILFMWASLGSFALKLLGRTFISALVIQNIVSPVTNIIERAVNFFSSFPVLLFSGKPSMILYFIMLTLVVLWLYRNVWRFYGRSEKPQFKLRFPFGDQGPSRDNGSRSQKEMEPELPDQ